MIRTGRYAPIEKWQILCRSWAGEEIKVGMNRRGNRDSVEDWRFAADRYGMISVFEYLRGDQAGEGELAALIRSQGWQAVDAKAGQAIKAMKASGFGGESVTDLSPAIVKSLADAFKKGALPALRWTDDKDEVPSLDVMRDMRKPYPIASIQGKKNVLSIFSAEYFGSLDVIHIYDAGPDSVTLLDYNPDFMDGMRLIYPPEWNYVCGDYKEFLQEATMRSLRYDLIATDAWRGMCSEVAFDMLPTIMALCADTIITHYCTEQFEELGAAPEDYEGLARALKARTGVDVVVTNWTRRSPENGCLVMRKPQ